jgi:hypothetical protein
MSLVQASGFGGPAAARKPMPFPRSCSRTTLSVLGTGTWLYTFTRRQPAHGQWNGHSSGSLSAADTPDNLTTWSQASPACRPLPSPPVRQRAKPGDRSGSARSTRQLSPRFHDAFPRIAHQRAQPREPYDPVPCRHCFDRLCCLLVHIIPRSSRPVCPAWPLGPDMSGSEEATTCHLETWRLAGDAAICRGLHMLPARVLNLPVQQVGLWLAAASPVR